MAQSVLNTQYLNKTSSNYSGHLTQVNINSSVLLQYFACQTPLLFNPSHKKRAPPKDVGKLLLRWNLNEVQELFLIL